MTLDHLSTDTSPFALISGDLAAVRVPIAQTLLGCSKATIYRLGKRGLLEIVSVAGITLVRLAGIKALLADATPINSAHHEELRRRPRQKGGHAQQK